MSSSFSKGNGKWGFDWKYGSGKRKNNWPLLWISFRGAFKVRIRSNNGADYLIHIIQHHLHSLVCLLLFLLLLLLLLSSMKKWFIAEMKFTVPTRCQFHQHFTRAFFVQKFCTKLFCTYILDLIIFGHKNICASALIKYWWNWPMNGSKVLLLFFEQHCMAIIMTILRSFWEKMYLQWPVLSMEIRLFSFISYWLVV